MVVLLVICTIILVICAFKWISRDKELYKFADQIPGPRNFAVIGSAHKILKKNEHDRFQAIRKILEKYQEHSLVKFWLGPILFVFVNDPKVIERVLDSSKCLDKSFFYKFLRLDKGLLDAKHELWQKDRKSLECSFMPQKVKNFVPIFAECADQMLESLEKTQDKSCIDIFSVTSRCSLVMILSTSFGINAADVHFNEEMLKAVEELRKIIVQRCDEPILYIKPLYRLTRIHYREKKYRKRWHIFLDQVIKERREIFTPFNNNIEQSTSKLQKDVEMGVAANDHKNFIDQLILHEGQFSDEEIHDHIYTFITAGYETTSLQVAFTLLLLAMHQDEQEKVYQEILEVFPTDDTTTSRENLESLHYLEMVIQESMRLLPPVPYLARKTQEQLQLDKFVVPVGVTLVVNLFNLHRKKDIWGTDAEEFRPERFLPENDSKRHSHSFLPFSQGPRDCIGKYYAMLAIRTVLVKFLRNYKITTNLKYEELKLKAELTLKICQSLKVKIEKR